jgi:phosphoglucomutase
VRDKDAVISAMLIAEMAAYYQKNGLNLLQVLEDLYKNMAITKRSSSLSTWKVQKGRRR